MLTETGEIFERPMPLHLCSSLKVRTVRSIGKDLGTKRKKLGSMSNGRLTDLSYFEENIKFNKYDCNCRNDVTLKPRK